VRFELRLSETGVVDESATASRDVDGARPGRGRR